MSGRIIPIILSSDQFVVYPKTVVSKGTLQKHLHSPFNGHIYDVDCFTITDPEIRKVGEEARKLWQQKEFEKAEISNLDVVTKKGNLNSRRVI